MKSHGTHIKIIGSASGLIIGDIGRVRRALEELVESIGMRALAPAVMYEVKTQLENLGVEPFEDEGGITGVVVLSTSHIAVHTWPLRNLFIADVFSCREFSATKVLDHFVSHFGATRLKMKDFSDALIYE